MLGQSLRIGVTRMRLPEEIDLNVTLFSGQTFLWKRPDGGYLGCVEDNAVWIDEAHNLSWDGPADEAYWRRYFDTNRDYAAIAARYADDPYVSAAFTLYGGMRILNQPPWETLCAFVISANNNITRIGSIIAKLSERFGARRCIAGQTVYAFPQPEALLGAGEAELRTCGLGYRAPYLIGCARRVTDGFDLTALPEMGYASALKALMTLPGVGEKVADCILLFSGGYPNAFPVDVWVRRVMCTLYGTQEKIAAIKAEGLRLFGDDAGVVQQVLFHAARMGKLCGISNQE